MTNFGTGHLQKIVIFKLLLKPSFARSFGHLGLFARSNSLNANRHLVRFVTFEVVICEVLLYNYSGRHVYLQDLENELTLPTLMYIQIFGPPLLYDRIYADSKNW